MRNRMMLALALAGLVAAPALAQDAEQVEAARRSSSAAPPATRWARTRRTASARSSTAIIGRTAGTLEDFNYSKAMVEAGAGGLVWNEETLMPTSRIRRAW